MRFISTPAVYITPILLMSLSANATPVFIEGVSEASGWYDVNKRNKWDDWPTGGFSTGFTPQVPSEYYSVLTFTDTSMCWAAAGANTLQWWQDRRGNVPTGTPNGLAATASVNGLQYVAQLQIYQTICNNWADGGSHVEQAWNWWFNGGSLNSVAFPGSTSLSDESTGGYWKSLGRTCTLNDDASYDTSKLCDAWYFIQESAQTSNSKEIIKSYIDRNYGTTLSLSGDGGHAITLWGYEETEENGLVLYLTDSDDYAHELFKQAVIMSDEGYLCLGSIDGEEEKYATWDSATGSGLFISAIHGLTVPIPEPSAFGFLAGILGLALVTSRRRKSKA